MPYDFEAYSFDFNANSLLGLYLISFFVGLSADAWHSFGKGIITAERKPKLRFFPMCSVIFSSSSSFVLSWSTHVKDGNLNICKWCGITFDCHLPSDPER